MFIAYTTVSQSAVKNANISKPFTWCQFSQETVGERLYCLHILYFCNLSYVSCLMVENRITLLKKSSNQIRTFEFLVLCVLN